MLMHDIAVVRIAQLRMRVARPAIFPRERVDRWDRAILRRNSSMAVSWPVERIAHLRMTSRCFWWRRKSPRLIWLMPESRSVRVRIISDPEFTSWLFFRHLSWWQRVAWVFSRTVRRLTKRLHSHWTIAQCRIRLVC